MPLFMRRRPHRRHKRSKDRCAFVACSCIDDIHVVHIPSNLCIMTMLTMMMNLAAARLDAVVGLVLLAVVGIISLLTASNDSIQSSISHTAANQQQPKQKPLKIFLMSGQSNMVGMGSLEHLNLLVQDSTSEYSRTLWNGTAYKERDDVWMIYNSYEERFGKLTAGNNGFAGKNSFGPELMFGWTVGDALEDEHILLLKSAWGGRHLAIDFRSPSSGAGNYTNVHPAKCGWECRQMVEDIHRTLQNLSAYNVPGYSEKVGYSLEGFVWFQGWNDLLDMKKVQEYGPNLANFIRDVRRDFDAPHLPFGMYVCCCCRDRRRTPFSHCFFIIFLPQSLANAACTGCILPANPSRAFWDYARRSTASRCSTNFATRPHLFAPRRTRKPS